MYVMQKLLSVGASPAPRFPTGSVSGSAHRPSPASSRNGDADPVEVVSIDGTRSGMGTAGGVAGSASVGTDCVDVSLDDDGAGVEPGSACFPTSFTRSYVRGINPFHRESAETSAAFVPFLT